MGGKREKMKIEEFVQEYKGFGHVESYCLVKMVEDDGHYLILFENMASGTSVTNASEIIATEVVNDWKLDPADCRFFETYPEYDNDGFSEINYVWKTDPLSEKWKALDPKWKPAEEEKKILLG